MASKRSRSPSTPSEGEIVESGSDTKATTSQTSLNGINVDRNPRNDAYSPRSPVSVGRAARRERSRSRSPYRATRGEKRRRDDYEYDRGGRLASSRAQSSRYDDDRYYQRKGSGRHRDGYYDHDRSEAYPRHLSYNDGYDRRSEKRPRTQSRSPFREPRKQRRYSSDEEKDRSERERAPPQVANSRSRRAEDRKISKEQLVTEREGPSVGAHSKQDAEYRETQMQPAPPTDSNVSEKPVNGNKTAENEEPSEPVDEAALIELRRKRREAIKAKYRGQATPLLVKALQIGAEGDPSARNQAAGSSNQDTSVSGQESPLPTPDDTSGAQSPTDLNISRDEDLANTDLQDRSGLEKDGPSAADYDPTLDMRQDRIKHDKRHFGDDIPAGAYDETKTTHQILVPEPTQENPTQMKAEDPFDMFAEDDDDMFAEEKPAPTSHQPSSQSLKPSVAQPQELDMSMMDNWDDPEGYYNVMLGELINGRYHVHQNLGRGMFSSVVRGTDSKSEKLVAVKIIRNNDTMRKAGMKEIEILQQLRTADPEDKKHIIRFDRYFDHKGHLCMVFENLSMNLREVLKKFGRDVGLNLRAIRTYAQQMFLGLSLMRKCNILHADLKPDNLLVNENRNLLKICDLGSASPASEAEITPYLASRFYRAPEIILGIPYDYAIDMWSIGCTLFELYSGKILFTGRNNNQMLRLIMECRGKFPPKFLRRGTLTHLHFDDLLNFRSIEEDKVTGRMVTRVLDFKKPTRDLKTRLMGKGARLNDTEAKEISLFIDLLDRCLSLNPEKRCTPSEALRHPFITRSNKA